MILQINVIGRYQIVQLLQKRNEQEEHRQQQSIMRFMQTQ